MNIGNVVAIGVVLTCATAGAATLRVGPGKPYAMPSAAANAAHDGDSIMIDAGDYVDCATWTKNNIVIRGVGGYAHVRDISCGQKGIWVIYGSNYDIEGIEFSGATVPDHNGAGIRMQGSNLIVRHCSFHDNQDGILGGGAASVDTTSTVLIEFSDFAGNGFGDGLTHNLYISNIKEFTLRGCTTRNASVGHDLKTRAFRNNILYNRIVDGDATASRCIDIPNGGIAYVVGNLIEQGPNSQNSNVMEFGLEGFANPGSQLYLINNTFVNDKPGNGPFVDLATGTDTLVMVNNIFAGPGTLLTRPATYMDTTHNLVAKSIASVKLANGGLYDYHLLAGSPAINTGTSGGQPYLVGHFPTEEYAVGDSTVPRVPVDSIDIGAYEFPISTGMALDYGEDLRPTDRFSVFPNPVCGNESMFLHGSRNGLRCEIFDALGVRVRVVMCAAGADREIDLHGLNSGVYTAMLMDGAVMRSTLFAVIR